MRLEGVRLLALMGLISLAAGCAQQLGDIDRTQTNVVEKAQLDGVWYMMDTVTDLPSTSRATFIGETSRTEKIVWVIEEELLLAYRSYPLVPGTEDVDRDIDYSAPDYRESPVAAYRILSHFDIQREYNAQTGEQTNVIVENSADQLWYERKYMRVDWSVNLVTNLDFISGWFYTPVEEQFFEDQERGLDRSVYWEFDDDGQLVYWDAPRKLLVQPDWYGCIISSPWYAWDYEDCAPAEVEITTSFARTDARRDYEPLPYSDQELSRFGYFRSERYVYDHERGVLESTRSRLANRHNIWQQNYQRDADGNLLRGEDGRLVPIPLAERQVRTSPVYMSPHFPTDPDFLAAYQDTIDEWNAIFRESVSLVQNVPMDQVPNVFVLCYNPVGSDDDPACGPAGMTVRAGDLRRNMLYWVESEQLEGPLGYGPVAADPETGEVLSSRAYVYGAGINRYATYGLGVIRFMNGDLEPSDLVDAQHVRDQVLARAERSTNLERVAPELREVPVGSRHLRDPVRMQLREQRRHNLHRFDRQGAMNRLESLRGQGIARLAGGDPVQSAIAGRLNRPADQIDSATWDELDPVRWLSPTHLNDLRRQRLAAMARSADYADMVDPYVIGLAQTYQGRTDYDQIWRELRAQIFRSTALHEFGHTLGLRHNFQATYDSLNYHDEYWALRRENLFPAQYMFDLYELNALTDTQIQGRMREFQYSSIMDYGYTFNTDTQGLGKYDRAAIVYGYTSGSVAEPMAQVADCSGSGRVADPSDPSRCLVNEMGFVEVFRKRLGDLGRAGEILTSLDENGLPYDDQTTPNVPYLERWHYTTVIQSFPAIDDAFDREWMRIGDVHAQRAAGGDAAPVRVPYLFCSDEWTEALLSCQVFDAGADPFEMTQTILDDYRAYYYFRNFKRDRLGWDEFNTLFSTFYYTFLPLSNYFQNWYLAPEGADSVMDDYWWLAINAGFNLIAESIATPPYGNYCTSRTDDSLVWLSNEPGFDPTTTSDFFLNAYCDKNAPFFDVQQGDGRRRFTAYDVDTGYNFGFLPLEAGHYWTTLAAFWALTDPEAYVLGTDADLGTFAISYYDFFDQEVHKLVNAVMTETYTGYSPTLEITDPAAGTGVLHYPPLSPVYDYDLGLSINPETGEGVTAAAGPSREAQAICEECNSNDECLGSTGFLGGTFCQPIDDSGVYYCLQDCFDDETLCADDETCDDNGNCVPNSGVCEPKPCSPTNPYGTCDAGMSCYEGNCQQPWPTVETDATFSLMDDMMFYGMFYTTFGYSTRYNDQIDVFRMGTDEELHPGAGFEVVTFTDPISGDDYGALREVCEDDGAAAPLGGATGMCESCDTDEECAGYNGEYGGVWCQPIVNETDEVWYCLVDCTEEDNCPDGTTCNEAGNCVPDGVACDDLAGACDTDYPLGSCDDGETCVDSTCESTDTGFTPSVRCQLGLSETSGAARMVERGAELAAHYNTSLDAYWRDDGSDPERENRLYADFARARWDLENHISKLNVIRAVFRIFGRVY